MSPATSALPSPKEQFLQSYDREHATTMRVLRAYPTDQLDLRPHAMCKTARDLAWVFVVERGLGTFAFNDGFSKGGPPGAMPKPPEKWDELLEALEGAHAEFGKLVGGTSDEALMENVKFFSGPKMMSDVSRIGLLWFLMMDQIHHRGQFSIYLRMAGGKVPSIYGPTADEPWS